MSNDQNKNSNLMTIIGRVGTFVPIPISLYILHVASSGKVLDGHLIELGAFVLGFMGVIGALRREIFAWPNPITGRRAVIWSILVILFCWGLAGFAYFAGLK
jgi:hypothetical protein